MQELPKDSSFRAENKPFLIAGEPSVDLLTEELYKRKKAAILASSPQYIDLGMDELQEIEMMDTSLVLAEGAGPCLIGYLKYGTKVWVWHASPPHIDEMMVKVGKLVAQNIVTDPRALKGEIYLSLFSHSPLSERVIESLGLEYDEYQQKQAEVRENIPVTLRQKTSQQVPVIVRSYIAEKPNQVTHTFFDSEENNIWYTTFSV